MNCPICNIPLKNTQHEDQHINMCPNCGGMWLDEGRFKKVVASVISKNKVSCQTVKETYRKKSLTDSRNKQPVRKCPQCNTSMDIFNYFYDSNIFLDKCSSCGGIWADRGEIKEVAKYLKGNPEMHEFAKAFSKAQAESIFLKRRMRDLSELSSDLMTPVQPGSFGKLLIMRLSLFPIPLKDDMPIRKFAKVTWGIITINILAFMYQLIFVKEADSYFNSVGIIPSLRFSINRMYSYITAMFVHGGFLHIAGNMFYLWLFGDNIEDDIGSAKFVIFYLLCGMLGSLVFCFFHPSLNEPVIGASGAISGILGAYLVLHPKGDLDVLWLGRVRTIHSAYYLLFWIIYQLILGVTILATKNTHIGYWAHIGGFISGVALIHLFAKTPVPK